MPKLEHCDIHLLTVDHPRYRYEVTAGVPVNKSHVAVDLNEAVGLVRALALVAQKAKTLPRLTAVGILIPLPRD